MSRYFLGFSYKGTHFHGWQLQPNAHTVQAEVNRALSLLLGHDVDALGCGRTDTGVHARKYVAHFDADKNIPDTGGAIAKLNRILPHDVSVYELYEVNPEAHARFDATSRTYKYFITAARNPFLQEFAVFVHFPLNLDAMNAASAMLLQQTDFTSFAKLHSDVTNNDCHVTEAYWSVNEENSTIIFTISASRFLRNMVRAIVGALLDVGRGKLTLDDFKNIMEQKKRCSAVASAPARGLFLWEVAYGSK
ncbi:MAG: tRNA pseudouridine(38-40) synthase TruA [Prevotellaceae bacterium]|jgi:tRNA pseudouridine38-40 synthase|nr:tRNA pseudouridine(38-40) synthase TruA [Prevotellaceae bacterium]